MVPQSKSAPKPLCPTVPVFQSLHNRQKGSIFFPTTPGQLDREAVIFVHLFSKLAKIPPSISGSHPVSHKDTNCPRDWIRSGLHSSPSFLHVHSASLTPNSPHSFTKYNAEISVPKNQWIQTLGKWTTLAAPRIAAVP